MAPLTSSTYIASGNLIADVPGKAPTRSTAPWRRRSRRSSGSSASRSRGTPAQVKNALDSHPFTIAEPKYSYVTFLLSKPTAEAVNKAKTYETGDDEWKVIGTEMHIRYANGAGRPDMKVDSIGRALKVPGTARNLNTVKKLIELADG